MALFIVPAQAAEVRIIEGRVVGVADGDTISILDGDNRQHNIRLNRIDAPEKGHAFRQYICEANVLNAGKAFGESYGIGDRCRIVLHTVVYIGAV